MGWDHLYDQWRSEYATGDSIRTIAARHGASTMAVRGALRGLTRAPKRIELARPDYFHDINTPAKAYWLGMMFADGSVIEPANGQPLIQLALMQRPNTSQIGNEYTLVHDRFREALGTTAAVTPTPIKNGIEYRCAFRCAEMAFDLSLHGLFPRKGELPSAMVHPALMPRELLPDFARGNMDGDGSVELSLNKKTHTGHQSWRRIIRFRGNKPTMDWLATELRLAGFLRTSSAVVHFADGTYSFFISPHDTAELAGKMYLNDSSLCLLRKRKRLQLHPQDWEDAEEGQRLPSRKSSPVSCSEAAHRGGVARRERYKMLYDEQAIKEARLSGMSYAEIEALFGCSRIVTLRVCSDVVLPNGRKRIRANQSQSEFQLHRKAQGAVFQALYGIMASQHQLVRARRVGIHPWMRTITTDPIARELADRHYSRRSPGKPLFLRPGKNLVYITEDGKAVITFNSEMRNNANAWEVTLFRNEGEHLSSDLIRKAVKMVMEDWVTPPHDGIRTYVDPKKVATEVPGYCFRRAGWKTVGKSKNGRLLILRAPRHDDPSETL